MENSQLSVIIVSYNEGEYIKTCICLRHDKIGKIFLKN